jgi:glycosyltransferase involved in cell wall biosynthesis
MNEISIIIPTLNEERFLPSLLQDLKNQNYNKFEIIVCDANSNDKTVALAKAHDCEVLVSNVRNISHQRNLGALKAKSNILLFLDADTRLPQNFLEKSIEEFEKRKLDIAGFYIGTSSEKLLFKVAKYYGYVIFTVGNIFHPVAVGAAILVRKEWHKKVGGFDGNIFVGEDHYYARSIQKKGGKFGILKSTKIHFSVRRFEKYGFLRVFLEWHYLVIYYLIKGPIKEKVVEYKFGDY